MTVQDPVCGRKIDVSEAVASVDHDGWAYFFCSEECYRTFRADPARFGKGRPVPAQQMKGQVSNA